MPRAKKSPAKKPAATSRKQPAKAAANRVPPPEDSAGVIAHFQQWVDSREDGQEYADNLENPLATIAEAIDELDSAPPAEVISIIESAIEEIGESVPAELLESPHALALITSLNTAIDHLEAKRKPAAVLTTLKRATDQVGEWQAALDPDGEND